MNRTPIVGLKKFRFDDRRCGSFVCVRIEERYDDGFRREALELIKSGAGKDALARRLPSGVYREKLDRAVQVQRRGGGHGRRRQQTLRLGDEGRRVARPRRERSDQDGGHGQAPDRGIASLERWCRDYRSGGPEALRPKPKGRPKGARSKPKPEPTREQELAEQVAYLKAKVAYLEKLRALRASKSRGASEAPSSDCSQGGNTGSTTS